MSIPMSMSSPSTEPTLIFADPHNQIWVLNKPAHYLTHSDGSGRPDLLSFIAQSEVFSKWSSLSFHPLHRLDLGTSGLICFSTSPRGVQTWQHFWQNHQIEKRYLGLVGGIMRPKGIIKRPLKDQRRKKALEAKTRYRTLWRFEGCCLVEFRPQHGRKHQIRRHIQSLGYALSGDTRYTSKKNRHLSHTPDRLWLHAHRLHLSQDSSQDTSLASLFGPWKAPLPDDLKDHLLKLGGEEILARLDS